MVGRLFSLFCNGLFLGDIRSFCGVAFLGIPFISWPNGFYLMLRPKRICDSAKSWAWIRCPGGGKDSGFQAFFQKWGPQKAVIRSRVMKLHSQGWNIPSYDPFTRPCIEVTTPFITIVGTPHCSSSSILGKKTDGRLRLVKKEEFQVIQSDLFIP